MSTKQYKTITYLIVWPVILGVFWLLLSGFFKPLLLTLGVISVALVVVLLKRMDRIDDQPQHLSFRFAFFHYIVWLIGEVVKSSIQVTKLVWAGGKNVTPALAKLPVDHISPKTRVLYANSITLTPGTLCIDLDESHINVHALEASSIEALKRGDMANRASNVIKDNQ